MHEYELRRGTKQLEKPECSSVAQQQSCMKTEPQSTTDLRCWDSSEIVGTTRGARVQFLCAVGTTAHIAKVAKHTHAHTDGQSEMRGAVLGKSSAVGFTSTRFMKPMHAGDNQLDSRL